VDTSGGRLQRKEEYIASGHARHSFKKAEKRRKDKRQEGEDSGHLGNIAPFLLSVRRGRMVGGENPTGGARTADSRVAHHHRPTKRTIKNRTQRRARLLGDSQVNQCRETSCSGGAIRYLAYFLKNACREEKERQTEIRVNDKKK